MLYYKTLAEEKFKWPGPADELLPLAGEQIDWLLLATGRGRYQPVGGHKILHYRMLTHQIQLFDEAELEAEIDALRDQLPDDVEEEDAPRASRKRRQRGFSDVLLRERIELTLSDEEKVGASKVFFTKVKEEL